MRAWLYRIATNRSLDALRAGKRRRYVVPLLKYFGETPIDEIDQGEHRHLRVGDGRGHGAGPLDGQDCRSHRHHHVAIGCARATDCISASR